MQDIPELRSYTRKVFDLGDGTKSSHFHIGHQHYKDSGGLFLPIDTTLNKTQNGWSVDKASYAIQVPDFADGTFEFVNNYEGAGGLTIAMRPVCAHVGGQEFNDPKTIGNFILYPDAFGKNVDLRCYAYRHGIKKIIVINQAPNTGPMSFDFEILPDVSMEFVRKGSQIPWDKASQFDFTNDTVLFGKADKFSYFRNAWVWDSSGLRIPVTISIFISGGKIILRKTIPQAFLQKAVYPVFTDHPTQYFAGAGDGETDKTGAFAATHDAATGDNADSTSITTNGVGLAFSINFTFTRSYFPIDTTGLSGVVSAAVLNLYVLGTVDLENDAKSYMTIVQTTQADPTTLVVDDYSKCGLATNPTEGIDVSQRKDITGISLNAYLPFTLNSTGQGWINASGYSLFGCREGHDTTKTSPATNGNENVTFSTSEGVLQDDPYIEITTGTASIATSVQSKKRMLTGVGL